MLVGYALLTLWRRSLLATAGAALSAALALGALSVFMHGGRQVLERPLACDPDDRVVVVSDLNPSADIELSRTSLPFLSAVKREVTSVEAVVAIRPRTGTTPLDGVPREVATGELWGEPAAVFPDAILSGSWWENGATQQEAAVITTELWRRLYGGLQWVPGRVIEVNGRQLSVSGILKEHAEMPPGAEIYFPLGAAAFLETAEDVHAFLGYCRLKNGVRRAEAERDIRAIRRQSGWTTTTMSLRDRMAPENVQDLSFLSSAVSVVALLGLAGSASLLWARQAPRHRDFWTFEAIGIPASAQVLAIAIDALVPVLVGASLGLGVSLLALPELRAFQGLGGERLAHVRPDVEVLLFCAACACLGALLTAAGSVFLVRSSMWTGSVRRNLTRIILSVALAAQTALGAAASTLYIGVSSRYESLANREWGYDLESLLFAKVDLSEDSSARGLAALDSTPAPGGASLAVVSDIPLRGTPPSVRLSLGDSDTRARSTRVSMLRVTSGWFGVAGLRVLGGSVSSMATGRVAVLSRSAAAELFEDASPLGARVWIEGEGNPYEVVGLVGDVWIGPPQAARAGGAVFLPFAESTTTSAFVVARNERLSSSALPGRIRMLAPDVTVGESVSGREVTRASLEREVFFMRLTEVVVTITLVASLACVVGLVRLTVLLRRRYLALLIALGASEWTVAFSVLLPVLWTTLAGGLLGIGAAFALRSITDVFANLDPRRAVLAAAAVAIPLLVAAITVAIVAVRKVLSSRLRELLA